MSEKLKKYLNFFACCITGASSFAYTVIAPDVLLSGIFYATAEYHLHEWSSGFQKFQFIFLSKTVLIWDILTNQCKDSYS